MNKKTTKTQWVKHVIKEGSRQHVLFYDTQGVHCSYKNCEINKPKIDTNAIKEDLSDVFTPDNMEKCMRNSREMSRLSVEDMMREFTI